MINDASAKVFELPKSKQKWKKNSKSKSKSKHRAADLHRRDPRVPRDQEAGQRMVV